MEVRFYNGGFCRQIQAMADRRTWRVVKFQAVFLAVAHPRLGWVLVDTGYGTGFAKATQDWPHLLYRWMTPVVSPLTTANLLKADGIKPGEIRHVILTHFHADHIGGTGDFPNATFHYATEALAPLLGLSAWAQTRNAFLPKLLPGDFASRSQPVSLAHFQPDSATGFPAHDLFGDGTLTMLDMPGHAPGHLGVGLMSSQGHILYAADAYWHHRQIDDAASPLPPARLVLHNNRDYDQTVARLRELRKKGTMKILACHCPETQKFIRG